MASIEHRALHDKYVKIIKIKDYDGEYFYDESSQEYFSEVEDMEKVYRKEKWDMPKYVYGCSLTSFSLDADNILENEAYDHHEDILDTLDGVEELKVAIEKFNKENESRGSYFEDVMTIIDLE